MLTNFLRDNKDILAWKPVDMPGVLRELAEHKIDINEGSMGDIPLDTLMAIHGPHHPRWHGPQDQGMHRKATRCTRHCNSTKSACNPPPLEYIRRGRGPLEDRSYIS
jgi:hypothetical protein